MKNSIIHPTCIIEYLGCFFAQQGIIEWQICRIKCSVRARRIGELIFLVIFNSVDEQNARHLAKALIILDEAVGASFYLKATYRSHFT